MNTTAQAHGNSQAFAGLAAGSGNRIPEVNIPPMPVLNPPGVILNGRKAERFGEIDSTVGYPDARSFRKKFGLVVPATNTSMEHELWSIILQNQELRGVGMHTTGVITPRPTLAGADDLGEYQKQFLDGLRTAVDAALLADPHYMIMGMSLEHILGGLDAVQAPLNDITAHSGLAWATSHRALEAALRKFRARRIGLLTPFDSEGNRNATRMFAELGFDVVSSVGFSCAHALHIAHIPDWAKEKAILELLATDENRLDAIVQCGTNLSLIEVTERVEPVIGIPILGVNAVTFWYALRENGIAGPQAGAGRLLREF